MGCAPVKKPGRTLSIRPLRKIAIYGSHEASLVDAPWDDDSWEHWGHASSRAWYRRELDRYFDLHPRACWSRGGKKTSLYPKWLKRNTVPIYMQDKFDEIPASIRYPKGRVLTEFSFAHHRHHFRNQVAWMVALALIEGVDTIGLWGIEYGTRSEYQIQRGSCEYWLGLLDGRGVKVVLPEQCTLLNDPRRLYGYESHDAETGKRVPEYAEKDWDSKKEIKPTIPGVNPGDLVAPPAALIPQIELEEMENPRPAWAFVPPVLKGNGRAHG